MREDNHITFFLNCISDYENTLRSNFKIDSVTYLLFGSY